MNRKYLYWADTLNSSCGGGTTIGRANIDGSAPNPSFIKGGQLPAHGIAVNGSFIYWARPRPNSGTGTAIGRRQPRRHRGQCQLLIPKARRGRGESRSTMATSTGRGQGNGGNGGRPRGRGSIGRANLDGSGVNENFITTGVGRPYRHHGERRAHLLVERMWHLDRTREPQRNGGEPVVHQGNSAARRPCPERTGGSTGPSSPTAQRPWVAAARSGVRRSTAATSTKRFIAGASSPTGIAVDGRNRPRQLASRGGSNSDRFPRPGGSAGMLGIEYSERTCDRPSSCDPECQKGFEGGRRAPRVVVEHVDRRLSRPPSSILYNSPSSLRLRPYLRLRQGFRERRVSSTGNERGLKLPR